MSSIKPQIPKPSGQFKREEKAFLTSPWNSKSVEEFSGYVTFNTWSLSSETLIHQRDCSWHPQDNATRLGDIGFLDYAAV